MNTPAIDVTKPAIDQLRERHEALQLQAEIATLESSLRGLDLSNRLVESEWGELVNRREHLYDSPGFGPAVESQRITSASDYARGKMTPIFENEQDLALIRGIGRFIRNHYEVGVGIIENLVSFTLGNGFVYEAVAKKKGEAPEALLDAINSCIDEFHEANGWTCEDGSNSLEEELLDRDVTDGEFLAFVDGEGGDGIPRVRVPEPDYLTEPARSRDVEEYFCRGVQDYDWSFGVASHPIHTDEHVAYYFQWQQASANWDVIGAHEVVHSKRNVPRRVKRGVSDFYAAYQNLERAGKLLGNTLQGAAIQATIAYIREHVAGTSSSQVESFRNANSNPPVNVSRPGGGVKQVRTEKFNPGRVIDTNGTKYIAGPLGQPSAPIYVQVMQAALRTIGVRWTMPEYMISGDASNANYASTLVAGSPFDRATQRRQGGYKGKFGRVHWQVLAINCKRGRFAPFGIYRTEELRAAIELNIEAPEVSIENKKEAEEIRKIRSDAGILSKRTWSAQASLDYDEQQANITTEPKPLPPMLGGIFGQQGQPQPGQQQQPAKTLESVGSLAQAKQLLQGYP